MIGIRPGFSIVNAFPISTAIFAVAKTRLSQGEIFLSLDFPKNPPSSPFNFLDNKALLFPSMLNYYYAASFVPFVTYLSVPLTKYLITLSYPRTILIHPRKRGARSEERDEKFQR